MLNFSRILLEQGAFIMMKKATFTIPMETYENLSSLSNLLGISKSAFLSELLKDSLSQMHGMMSDVLENQPENLTSADVVRFRGKSEEIVRSRIDNLGSMADDLFSK